MTQLLTALTLSGFREAIRNRVTVVVAVFAIALILLTSVVLNVTIFSLDRVVTDFGLGVMSLILVGLSIFMSVGMLNREIERRTVFLVVSRPLSRATFIFGRYLGLVLTLTVLLLAMSAIYATQLFLFDVPPTPAMVAAVVGLWFQLLVLGAMGVFFSAMSGTITSTISVVGLYLVGHWTRDLYVLAEKLGPGLREAARLGYWVLPNLAQMDFKTHAAGLVPIDALSVLRAGASALGWVGLFLVGAALLFQRRDFR